MNFTRCMTRCQVSLQQVIRNLCSTSCPPKCGIIAAKHPFKVETEANKLYTWCACGHSHCQPFCDGTHNTVKTELTPMKFKVEKTGNVYLCGCKQTGHAPYCDGTHKKSWVQQAALSTCPTTS